MLFARNNGNGHARQDLWLCFWLANFGLISAWEDAIRLSSKAINYYRARPADSSLLLPALLNALLLTLVLWCIVRLVRLIAKPAITTAAQAAFILAFVVPIRHMLTMWVRPEVGLTSSIVMQRGFELAVAVSVFLLIFFRIRAGLWIGKAVISVVVPIMAFNLLCLSLWWRTPAEAYSTQASASALKGQRSPRVVWILLDEMDQRLAFTARPATVRLLEFDRLRREAIHGTNVTSPAYWTRIAVPALLTGRRLHEATAVSPGDLDLTFDDGTRGLWSEQRTVFSRARDMGFNTGLAGWMHPYCRVIGSQLTECFSQPNEHMFDMMTRHQHVSHWGLLGAMSAQFVRQQDRVPLVRRLKLARHLDRLEVGLIREQQVIEHQRLLSESLRMVSNPNLGVVFVHLNVPHPVGIYSRVQNDVSLSEESNYLDNLELADRTVGELRRAMEKAGLWDSSTVLITSDHPLRADFWSEMPERWSREEADLTGNRQGELVPFILKLGGQSEGRPYELPFNNVLSHDLALAVLSGEVSRVEDAVTWLNNHRDRSLSLPERERNLQTAAVGLRRQ